MRVQPQNARSIFSRVIRPIMGNLMNGILDCEGRLLEDTGIQMLQSNGLLVLLFFLLLWLVLDEETGKLYR